MQNPLVVPPSSSSTSCSGGGARPEIVVSATTMAFPRAVASASVFCANSGCCSSARSGSLGAKVSASAGLVLGAFVLCSAVFSTSCSGTEVGLLVCCGSGGISSTSSSVVSCRAVLSASTGEAVPQPAIWSGFSVDADLIYQRKFRRQ